MNHKINEQFLKKLIGMPTKDIFLKLKQKYHFKHHIQDLREERRYHYFKFLDNKNIIFPYAIPTLKKLRFDYKIALATGSSFATYSHSTNKEFQSLFDFVSTINDVKRGKPHADQFLYTAKKLKVNPKKCLVVGDSIYDGIGVKRAKMDFIGIKSGYNEIKELKKCGAIKIIKNIKELIKILR